MSWGCFWTLIMSVPNECPVGDCSRRPDQPHKKPSCWVVALFWVRPNQITTSSGRRAERLGTGKLECTSRSDNMEQSRALPCTQVDIVWTRCVPLCAASADDRRGVTWWQLSPPNTTLAGQLSTRCSLSRHQVTGTTVGQAGTTWVGWFCREAGNSNKHKLRPVFDHCSAPPEWTRLHWSTGTWPVWVSESTLWNGDALWLVN